MSDFELIYTVSLKDARSALRIKVHENNKFYEALRNKESDYAKAVKAIGDLHKKALAVYESAPLEI